MTSLDYPFRVISVFYFLHLLEDIVQTINVDIAIVGAGGGGLRAAIAAAEAHANFKSALVSKMRQQQDEINDILKTLDL